MALLLNPMFGGPEVWRQAFAAGMPDLEVRIWPEVGNPAEIEAAAVGIPPAGMFARLANLHLIFSLTAGTDALLRDPDLPDVPIVRAGDPAGDAMMNETALLHVLRHHRNMPAYLRAQARSEWKRLPVKSARERKVGVMGLGMIGLACARTVAALGFQVAGWVRTQRTVADIKVFSGADQFASFLARSEILLNLLPLTPETRGIIGARTLAQLPAGAAVINLGRGEHVVEADLIAALDSGHIEAATLDVYPVEPLPPESPLWRHPGITVMPHVARRLEPADLAMRICDILRRFRAGEPLPQLVDRRRGY